MMDFDTSKSAARLLDGSATQEDRDRILYFLASTRWTPDKLDSHIREVHHALCKTCPDRIKSQNNAQRPQLDWNGIIKALIYAFSILGTAIVALIKLIH
jgi:hypothetical protein